MPNKYLTIPGTWAFDGDDDGENRWWQKDSKFTKYLDSLGKEAIFINGEPFVWTTNLTGADWSRYLGKDPDHRDWQAGARALEYFCQNIPEEDRNVIAHSHGGQVALYAASYGLKLNKLLTVSTPVREDMESVIKLARPNIAKWTHIHSDASDKWQWFGELFDGHIGIVRSFPLADENILIPNVGHSKILTDPKEFDLWKLDGLVDRI